ncbi:MAG: response regulator transcription factor [Phycisphaerales bacterium]
MSKPTAKASAPARAVKASAAAGPGSGSASAPGVRVLCVDDHAVLVEGLKAQFSIDGRIAVVGRLGSAEKLLEEVARLRPDVVLLDIEMPGPDAFEMADRLRHMHAGVRVIFLSAHIRDGYISSAYRCGAWGYFAKSDDLTAICAGVMEVAQSREGTFVLGPKVRQRCRPAPAGGGTRTAAPATPLDSLTAREIEVLRLIGKGLSRTEIAEQLSRSAKTIDGHQERIMKKLRLESRAELMRFAIREGLAEA